MSNTAFTILFAVLFTLPLLSWLISKIGEKLHSRRPEPEPREYPRRDILDARTLERRDARLAKLRRRIDEKQEETG